MATSGPTDSCAAVVGAAGFLGQALGAALASDGVRVVRFTRHDPCLSSSGSLATGLIDADTVFWAASTVNPATAESRPARVSADHTAFLAVLDAFSTRPGRRRLVLLSSGGTVYDPDGRPPYSETAATRPIGAYGRAKLAMESALTAAGGALGAAVSARVSNAYGPGQPAREGQGVIAHWLAAATAGRPLQLFGDPATVRDFVYVGDVAQALLRIHRHEGALPGVVNVGSGTPTRLGELADLVLGVVGDPGLGLEQATSRSFDVTRTWLDSTLAERVLGWSARTSLRRGVEQTWQSVLTDDRDDPVRPAARA